MNNKNEILDKYFKTTQDVKEEIVLLLVKYANKICEINDTTPYTHQNQSMYIFIDKMADRLCDSASAQLENVLDFIRTMAQQNKGKQED